jgi:hypothetical protein
MMTKIENQKQEFVLNANNRCDSCGAQAYVQVFGVTGDLLFCAHHYNNIVDNAIGYDKIMKFAFNIVDERSRLTENRLKGDY